MLNRLRLHTLFVRFFIFGLALVTTVANAQFYPGNINGATGVPGTKKRNALNSLERSTAQGRTILTDGFYNQRWADYVDIEAIAIPFEPTPTGNAAFLSSFVVAPSGAKYYIDWQGKSILIEPASVAPITDYDWLEVGNNGVPNSINDSIYTRKYAAVGPRVVWPNATFLVGDSSINTNSVSIGDRNTRWGFVRISDGNWSSIGQEGGDMTVTLGPSNGGFDVRTAAGTGPTAATAPYVSKFKVDIAAMALFADDYPNTRDDLGNPQNLLSTDATGLFESHPIAGLNTAYGQFSDDAAAALGGVTVGQTYELTAGNPYGLPAGSPKVRRI